MHSSRTAPTTALKSTANVQCCSTHPQSQADSDNPGLRQARPVDPQSVPQGRAAPSGRTRPEWRQQGKSCRRGTAGKARGHDLPCSTHWGTYCRALPVILCRNLCRRMEPGHEARASWCVSAVTGQMTGQMTKHVLWLWSPIQIYM